MKIEFTIFYESVADLIASAQDRGVDISLALCKMRRDLENSEVISADIDKKWLFEGIDDTYKDADQKHNDSSDILLFVADLQEHVTEEYGSVDSYLEDNGIQVPQTFADISEAAGYSIDAGNIE